MLRSGRVYLVDTPGFDDTNRMDTEILRTLGAWLTATYSSGVQLSGIIYCHRINQTRMQGSAMKNIQLFRSLCGDDALRKVILVTTMWDIESRDIAEKREKELKETAKYWGRMVAKVRLLEFCYRREVLIKQRGAKSFVTTIRNSLHLR